MTLDLNPVARVIGGTGLQPVTASVTGWSVDSRTLEPGELFFALRGPITTVTTTWARPSPGAPWPQW